ncbi:hypothetical protein [Cognatilysobacter lacus]|uniref:Uncharacterized protein n=1 Tax=Cognatilysobacter lacus TaxID=1643323 RepID=A0A5D8ZFN6_9GAMM|nr:hypothetical protein [Lysobacter lacus]TZF91494.1 hypothetical protein FW784_01580 [Lysobacter lacus]
MLANPALYSRGPYRVVAHSAANGPARYVVLDSVDAWLRDDASFAAACAWVDRQVAEVEAMPPGRARTPSR